jgi:hypothetical protein
MTNKFHDELDAFEARVRAEQEETDLHMTPKTPLLDLLEKINSEIEKALAILDEGKRARLAKDEDEAEDDDEPTITKDEFEEKMARGLYFPLDGSDTGMMAQLEAAGFGSGGVM